MARIVNPHNGESPGVGNIATHVNAYGEITLMVLNSAPVLTMSAIEALELIEHLKACVGFIEGRLAGINLMDVKGSA